jgi:glycosyltransferase involved in cell wall biosynthesis
MKILTIIDGFPPEHAGGSEHVALNLSRGLQMRGHDVVVLTTTQNREREGESVHEGLRVIRLFSPQHSKLVQSYLGVRNFWIIKSFKEILKKENPDVVHFHNIHAYISYAALRWTKKVSKAKIFFTAHDVQSFAYTRLTHFIDPKNPAAPIHQDYRMTFPRLWHQAGRTYNPFRRMLIRRYLKNATKIFTVSDALGEAFRQNGILNVETVYNGIDLSRLEVSESDVRDFQEKHHLSGKKVVLFAGRPMSAKGLVPLIESFVKVLPHVSNAYLAMAIEGSYADHIRTVIAARGLESSAVILGLQKGREWAAMFHSSDVVAVPSIYFDPAPLVNMEAMAAKKPVIGTCFGGTPEIVQDGVTGYIVNPYDHEALADRLVTILTNDTQAHDFGVRGFERVRSRFTIDFQVDVTLAGYRSHEERLL